MESYFGHAYVKILDGLHLGKYFFVSTNNFKTRKFKSKDDFNPNMKYMVTLMDGTTAKSRIYHLEDTSSKLEEVIAETKNKRKKRPHHIPDSQIYTAESNDDELYSQKSVSSAKKSRKTYGLTKSNIIARSEEYSSIYKSQSKKKPEKDSFKETNKYKQLDEAFVSLNRCEISASEQGEPSCGYTRDKTNIISDSEDYTGIEENSSAINIDKENSKNITNSSLESIKYTSKPSISCIYCMRKDKHIVKIEKLLTSKNNEIKQLEKDTQKLKNISKNVKIKFEEAKEEAKKKNELNIKLQELIIERAEEKEVIASQLEAANKSQGDSESHDPNHFPIGYTRTSNNTVHVGKGQFINLNQFYNVRKNAKSPATCAGYILSAVFGEELLIKSTVSGKQSNRTIKLQKSFDDSLPQNKTPLPLDPLKLDACRDFYEKWLTTKWFPNITKQKMLELLKEIYSTSLSAKRKFYELDQEDQEAVKKTYEATEKRRFQHYCSGRISYFKKQPKPKIPKCTSPSAIENATEIVVQANVLNAEIDVSDNREKSSLLSVAVEIPNNKQIGEVKKKGKQKNIILDSSDNDETTSVLNDSDTSLVTDADEEAKILFND